MQIISLQHIRHLSYSSLLASPSKLHLSSHSSTIQQIPRKKQNITVSATPFIIAVVRFAQHSLDLRRNQIHKCEILMSSSNIASDQETLSQFSPPLLIVSARVISLKLNSNLQLHQGHVHALQYCEQIWNHSKGLIRIRNLQGTANSKWISIKFSFT